MEIEETVEQLNRSNAYIERKKYAEADKILDKLLKEIEPVEIDNHGRILDFTNRLED